MAPPSHLLVAVDFTAVSEHALERALDLASHLGARVVLRHSARRGRIIIEYRGNEDLQRVLEKMGVNL